MGWGRGGGRLTPQKNRRGEVKESWISESAKYPFVNASPLQKYGDAQSSSTSSWNCKGEREIGRNRTWLNESVDQQNLSVVPTGS